MLSRVKTETLASRHGPVGPATSIHTLTRVAGAHIVTRRTAKPFTGCTSQQTMKTQYIRLYDVHATGCN